MLFTGNGECQGTQGMASHVSVVESAGLVIAHEDEGEALHCWRPRDIVEGW